MSLFNLFPKPIIVKPIPGLIIVPDFLSYLDEETLIKTIVAQKWNTKLKRLTQHYGYEYDYTTKSIDPVNKLGELPDWLKPCILKMISKGYMSTMPDQVIINRYLPGQGISPHIDSPESFENVIISLSLGSGCIMTYQNAKDCTDVKHIYLAPKSLLVMRDDARYKYKHGIRGVKVDNVNGIKYPRGTRYSITFRNIKKIKID